MRWRSAGRRWRRRSDRNLGRSGRRCRESRHNAGRPRSQLRAAPSRADGRANRLRVRAAPCLSRVGWRAWRVPVGRCVGRSGADRIRVHRDRDRRAHAPCARSERDDACAHARRSRAALASAQRTARSPASVAWNSARRDLSLPRTVQRLMRSPGPGQRLAQRLGKSLALARRPALYARRFVVSEQPLAASAQLRPLLPRLPCYPASATSEHHAAATRSAILRAEKRSA